MPNPRFYSAPIDPGWNQFGQAIASGMGQATQNWERNRYLEWQDQLRREALDREDERLTRQETLERNRALSQALGEGLVVDPEVNTNMAPISVEGPGGAVLTAFAPRPRQPTATQPTAARTPVSSEGAGGEAPTPIMGRAEISGPVEMATRQITEEGKAKTAKGDQPASMLKPGAYYDPYLKRIVSWDPARSRSAQQEAYTFTLNQQRQAAAREEIGNVIAQVLADGVIDYKTEAPLLLKWGIKPADLEDPEKAKEKAFKWWQKEFDIKQRGEETIARIQASSAAANRLTAAQQLEHNAENLRAKVEFDVERGVDPNTVYSHYLSEAQRLGIGLGVLRQMVTNAGVPVPDRSATEAQIMASARKALEDRGIYEDVDKAAYEQAMAEEMLKARTMAARLRREATTSFWQRAVTPPPANTAAPTGNAGARATPAVTGTWKHIEGASEFLKNMTAAQIRAKLRERPGVFSEALIARAVRTYAKDVKKTTTTR